MGTSLSCWKDASAAPAKEVVAEAAAPQSRPISEFIRKLNERRESNRLKELVRTQLRKQRVADLEEKYRCGYIDAEELSQLVSIENRRHIIVDGSKRSAAADEVIHEEAFGEVEEGNTQPVSRHDVEVEGGGDGAGVSSDEVADQPSQTSPPDSLMRPKPDAVTVVSDDGLHPHFVAFGVEGSEESVGLLQGTSSLTSGGELSQVEPSLAHCRSSLKRNSSFSMHEEAGDEATSDRRRHVRFSDPDPEDLPKRSRRSSFHATVAALSGGTPSSCPPTTNAAARNTT